MSKVEKIRAIKGEDLIRLSWELRSEQIEKNRNIQEENKRLRRENEELQRELQLTKNDVWGQQIHELVTFILDNDLFNVIESKSAIMTTPSQKILYIVRKCFKEIAKLNEEIDELHNEKEK